MGNATCECAKATTKFKFKTCSVYYMMDRNILFDTFAHTISCPYHTLLIFIRLFYLALLLVFTDTIP